MSPRTQEANDALHGERRKAILNAALDSFVEEGFEGTRMQEIADRCGMSYGLVLPLLCVEGRGFQDPRGASPRCGESADPGFSPRFAAPGLCRFRHFRSLSQVFRPDCGSPDEAERPARIGGRGQGGDPRLQVRPCRGREPRDSRPMRRRGPKASLAILLGASIMKNLRSVGRKLHLPRGDDSDSRLQGIAPASAPALNALQRGVAS